MEGTELCLLNTSEKFEEKEIVIAQEGGEDFLKWGFKR